MSYLHCYTYEHNPECTSSNMTINFTDTLQSILRVCFIKHVSVIHCYASGWPRVCFINHMSDLHYYASGRNLDCTSLNVWVTSSATLPGGNLEWASLNLWVTSTATLPGGKLHRVSFIKLVSYLQGYTYEHNLVCSSLHMEVYFTDTLQGVT